MVHEPGDRYVVTGVCVDGRRFRVATDNPIHALGINLHRGTLWQIKAGENRRRVVRRVFN